jgi:hypothetical protein
MNLVDYFISRFIIRNRVLPSKKQTINVTLALKTLPKQIDKTNLKMVENISFDRIIKKVLLVN